jgi:uncharacterized protein with HEPN domain
MSSDLALAMHIRDSLREVGRFVEGMSYEDFLENRMAQSGVMR